MFGGGVSYRVICVYGHSLIQNKPVGHIAKYTFYLFTGIKIFYRVRGLGGTVGSQNKIEIFFHKKTRDILYTQVL